MIFDTSESSIQRHKRGGAFLEDNPMTSAATGQGTCVLTQDERANVVSSDAEIKSLLSSAAWPWPEVEGSMLDPRFFLATIDKKTWIPRIVVVTARERITGLAYFKERRISRFGAGIL